MLSLFFAGLLICHHILYRHIELLTPGFAQLILPPFKKKKICSRKRNNYSQIIWKMMYHSHHGPGHVSWYYCFHICDTKSTYLQRYGRPTCAAFFTCSSICRTQASPRKSFFALTKHINAVSLKLHRTACWKKMPLTLHGVFGWHFCRIFILQFNFFTNCVFVVFPNYRIGGSVQCSLIAYCVQCNAYFALCAQTNKCTFFAYLHAPWVLDHIRSDPATHRDRSQPVPFCYSKCAQGLLWIASVCGIAIAGADRKNLNIKRIRSPAKLQTWSHCHWSTPIHAIRTHYWPLALALIRSVPWHGLAVTKTASH